MVWMSQAHLSTNKQGLSVKHIGTETVAMHGKQTDGYASFDHIIWVPTGFDQSYIFTDIQHASSDMPCKPQIFT